jgi:hypothetical protein
LARGSIEIIDGFLSLHNGAGAEIEPPQRARIHWTTEESGFWLVHLATSHTFRGPHPGLTWLRFTDLDGRVRLNQPQDPYTGDLIFPATV